MSHTIIFETYNPENVEKARILSEALETMGSISIERNPPTLNDTMTGYMSYVVSAHMHTRVLEVYIYFDGKEQFEAASEVASTWDTAHHISRYCHVQGEYLEIADDGSINIGNLLSDINPYRDY